MEEKENQMTINELVKEAYEQAKKSGWHETERSPLEYHALIHSEVSEATEEVRNGKPLIYFRDDGKPEGEAVELADIIIRVADYAGAKGIDLEDVIQKKLIFNRTRSHRHGGKKY